jgi:hypothetical protein
MDGLVVTDQEQAQSSLGASQAPRCYRIRIDRAEHVEGFDLCEDDASDWPK